MSKVLLFVLVLCRSLEISWCCKFNEFLFIMFLFKQRIGYHILIIGCLC